MLLATDNAELRTGLREACQVAMKWRKAVMTNYNCVSGLFFENGWRSNQRKHSLWLCTFYCGCRQISPRRQHHRVPNKWCALNNDMHLITWVYAIFPNLVISVKALVHFKGRNSLILFLFMQFSHAFSNYSTCSVKNNWRRLFLGELWMHGSNLPVPQIKLASVPFILFIAIHV